MHSWPYRFPAPRPLPHSDGLCIWDDARNEYIVVVPKNGVPVRPGDRVDMAEHDWWVYIDAILEERQGEYRCAILGDRPDTIRYAVYLGDRFLCGFMIEREAEAFCRQHEARYPDLRVEWAWRH